MRQEREQSYEKGLRMVMPRASQMARRMVSAVWRSSGPVRDVGGGDRPDSRDGRRSDPGMDPGINVFSFGSSAGRGWKEDAKCKKYTCTWGGLMDGADLLVLRPAADDSARMSLSVGHVTGLIFIPDYESWPSCVRTPLRRASTTKSGRRRILPSMRFWGALLAAMFRSRMGERREDPGPDGGRHGREAGRFSWLLERALSMRRRMRSTSLFVPGRSCQVTDVLLDSCGVAAGAAVFIWL